jgi:hypothetical protein
MNSTFVDSDTANMARPTAVSEAYFGNLTIALKSSEAQVGAVNVRRAGSIAGVIVGDEIQISFGNYQQSSDYTNTASATLFPNIARSVMRVVPPVFLGPGSSLIMQPFSTGSSGASSFNVELAVIEMFHNPKRA